MSNSNYSSGVSNSSGFSRNYEGFGTSTSSGCSVEKCLRCPYRNSNISTGEGHTQTKNVTFDVHEKEKAKEEKAKCERNMPMSLCFALALRDAIYFAADSRSSSSLLNAGVGGAPLAVTVLDDDYLKITTLEVSGQTVVAYSTGLNQFDGKSFSDYLKSLPVNQAETVQDGLEQISKKIRQLNMENVFISFFYFTGLTDFIHAEYLNKGEKSCEFIPGQLKGDSTSISYSGANWGIELAKRLILPSDAKDESVISTVNDLFFHIRVLSPYFDNTIGGTIRIAKLTPNGFTWLQGEPT